MLPRRSPILVIASLVLLLGRVSASPAEWKRLATARFEIVTCESEIRARAALKLLENADTFFREASGLSFSSQASIRVVAFNSREQYAPFRLHRNAFGYYFHAREHDYIVVQDLDPDHLDALVHEYTHFVLHEGGVQLPLWLSEGLADFYGSLQFTNGGVLLGSPVVRRLATLQHRAWLPLSQIVGGDRHSSIIEGENASAFYAESWALVHMLRSRPPYFGHFREFTAMLANGTEPDQAVPAIYGRTIYQLEADLRAHIRQMSVAVPPMQFALEMRHSDPRVESVSAQDLEFLQATLLVSQPWTVSEGNMRLRLLRERYPDTPQLEELLATSSAQEQRQEQEELHLRKAVDLGSRNPATLYRLAQLEQRAGAPVSKVITLLETVVAIDPTHQDAALQLAILHFNQRDFAEAELLLSRLTAVPASSASTFYTVLAYCSIYNGNIARAWSLAVLAKQNAKTGSDKSQADVLLDRLQKLQGDGALGYLKKLEMK